MALKLLLQVRDTLTWRINTMANGLKKGDKVEWETSQGKTKGEIEKKLTKPTKIKSHKVAASKDNPEFLVKSSKSGKVAAHKPSALKKIKS
jgi:hypothetical protein